LKRFANILLIFIAIAFTILSGRVVPPKYFESYHLELDSIWRKETTDQEYLVDLNNDSRLESIRHNKINQSGNAVELKYNNVFQILCFFNGNEFFISRFLHFADINQDNIREIIFISATGNMAYLYIIGFDFKKQLPFLVESVKIDTICYSNNNVPDVVNNSIVTSHSDIYFDLQAGYSIQPRNVYKYDFKNKKLEKTKRSSIVTKNLEHTIFNGQEYLLAKKVRATGNTISTVRLETLQCSQNKDDLKKFQYFKDKAYQYSDFSSYILLYNTDLDYAFEPIDFPGWTNYTASEFFNIGNKPYIVAITNNENGDKGKNAITICDLHGNIVKQIPMPHDYTAIFTDNDNIVFAGNKALYLYSKKLKLIKEIRNISSACGFFDIDQDKKKEFIAFEKNELIVFSGDFRHKTTLKIGQEFAPFPEENGIQLLQRNGQSCILYNTRLFYYIFSYSQNHYAFVKYPFYLFLFAFWLGLLIVIIKLYSKRLEREKQKLEEIVTERTFELHEKNQELAAQKTEIQIQAKELIRQNKHLEELDQFKKTLTSTLVHDLKNPLGQILITSGNKTVNNLARRMLLLITNMLDVDKHEHTEMLIKKQMHPLRSILDEAVSTQEISLFEKNIDVKIHIDDVSVWADKEMIVRVFENLLSNAIRFSPQNQCIEIGANYTGNEIVKISIKNLGENIPADKTESIFEKYKQADQTESSSYKSTGLGLTFCKMVLQAHGHTIKAENLDGGVMFVFYLSGEPLSSRKIENTTAYNAVVLSSNEKEMLKPWFDQLNNFEINQASEIHEIVKQIPDSSENIIAIKQQIIDAVFASNISLFSRLIH